MKKKNPISVLAFHIRFTHFSTSVKKTIQLMILLTTFGFSSFSQNLISDSFNGITVNPSCNWIFPNQSPNPFNYYNTTSGNGELLIFASGENGGSDLCGCTNFSAPYLVQAVDTANHNFQIDTRLRFNPTFHWMSAGIVFQTLSDSSNGAGLLRMINYYHYQGTQQGINAVNGGVSYTDTIVYLRVQRAFGNISAWYSPNDTTWNLLSTIADNTPIYYVGLVSERYAWTGSTLLASTAYFDYFNVSTVTAGINEIQNEQSFAVYPNPSRDILTLSLSSKNTLNGIIKIKNILGETLIENNINASEINLNVSKLSCGVYFVSLENSYSTIVKQFIKE